MASDQSDDDFSWIEEGTKYEPTMAEMQNPEQLISKLMTD